MGVAADGERQRGPAELSVKEAGGEHKKKAPRGERSALKYFSDEIVRSAPT